ncbi:hypothetical protein M407DRAFT_243637 [Tulasnella calospora MUT 4182]|uniref:Uncharacterized protein n=1 Tax=Tulasnella calospora MUT 4182 TaxID=1051891 RepID=A0A0C3Q9F0_9AGAM|nr:hypothetical protein M407DRAFT_243637 [Tulasnella calospora MUT 4182]
MLYRRPFLRAMMLYRFLGFKAREMRGQLPGVRLATILMAQTEPSYQHSSRRPLESILK